MMILNELAITNKVGNGFLFPGTEAALSRLDQAGCGKAIIGQDTPNNLSFKERHGWDITLNTHFGTFRKKRGQEGVQDPRR